MPSHKTLELKMVSKLNILDELKRLIEIKIGDKVAINLVIDGEIVRSQHAQDTDASRLLGTG